jgi:predicted kinase
MASYDRDVPPVLVVVGGLPATGKSTIAIALARRTATPYLRVDRIEQAIVAWSALSHPLGPVGYAVAHALAREQLELGLNVIVECQPHRAHPRRLGRNG